MSHLDRVRFPLKVTALMLLPANLLFAESLEEIDFNRDIRPILSENCYACHGPDVENNNADLRLDLRDAAIEADALVPGDPDDSEMILRVLTDDPDEIMPPPKTHKRLTQKEKDLLIRWVKEGAEYDGHWSYQAVKRPDASSIDEVIEKSMAKDSLTFSPETDKNTLLRRVSLDLIGLPPSKEELETFLNDASPEAYEKVVDRLLTSPHYGETRARSWLDAVRFADTVGYHGDQNRDATPFRDYIIEAFNENMPYDQFTIEQIAGDLLPNPTIRQRIASSYNHLNQISGEVGIQDKEYIKKYQAERVRTTSTAWLGSTLACAECHDHKFDPFTAKDFYTFASFFADLLEKGARNGNGKYQEPVQPYVDKLGLVFSEAKRASQFGPMLQVPNRTFLKNAEQYEPELASRKAKLIQSTPSADAEFEVWMTDQQNVFNKGIVENYKADVAEDQQLKGLLWEGELPADTLDRFTFDIELVYPKKTPHPKAGLLFEFDQGHYLVTWSKDIQYEGAKVIQKNQFKFWAKNIAVAFKDLQITEESKVLRSIRLLPDSRLIDTPPVKFKKVSITSKLHQVPKGEFSKEMIAKLDAYLKDNKAKNVYAELRENYLIHHATSADLQASQKSYNDYYQFLEGSRYVPATISAKPREVKVLPRGNWMDESGEVVLPATPHFLPNFIESSEDKRLSRLDLAKWIASPENPLTSRAFVNRLWAEFFGTPLSSAPEDLGLQGEYPLYPKLLDWLAAEFVDSGWDMKHMVKLMVMSRAYRQTSRTTPELTEQDPYNRRLARQSPRRLPAEGIRDNALAISGLLNRHVGGASVKPYQPDGYYQHLNFPKRNYEENRNEHQYRRGIYTHWQRTFLHPMMIAFDAPSRDECTVARNESNTPLQALNLLNDPAFLEAAKAFADRLLQEETDTDRERIQLAFYKALSREATSQELELLEGLLAQERTRFESKPDSAQSFLDVGMYVVQNPKSHTETAAWMSVSRAILNLNETITRY